MSEQPLDVPKGDFGFDLEFTVRDYTGAVYDLTGYTIKLKVWKKGEPDTLLVDGSCTIDDAESGTCHYTIVDGNFDSVGKFKAELELTAAGKQESTRTFDLEVTESGE